MALTGPCHSRFCGGDMPKNHTLPSAGHGRLVPSLRSFDRRLARIERVANAIHKKLDEFRVSLEPLVPHVGAIEAELHSLSARLRRSRSRPKHLRPRR